VEYLRDPILHFYDLIVIVVIFIKVALVLRRFRAFVSLQEVDQSFDMFRDLLNDVNRLKMNAMIHHRAYSIIAFYFMRCSYYLIYAIFSKKIPPPSVRAEE
jgi:hypothetical protein